MAAAAEAAAEAGAEAGAGGKEKRRVSMKLIMAARFFKRDSLHYSQSSTCQEEGLDGYTVFKRIGPFFRLKFPHTVVI